MTCTAILFSVMAAWGISRSIYIPIKKLHDVTATITKNDLQALVTGDNVDEITELGMSFNIMIGKIRELVEAKTKEQEDLKKAEMRALQAQVNPHFLYNTLDTIVWMAESKDTAAVIEIVTALSSFFRISLSKGRDWITVAEEIERTRSYLTIQRMRYRDIMNFRIEVDERVAGNTILKLILQPLVENALYHGIKNKRGGGAITVRAKQSSKDEVLLEVEDDGIGFTPDRLAQIQAELEDDSGESAWKAASASATSTGGSGCTTGSSTASPSGASTTPGRACPWSSRPGEAIPTRAGAAGGTHLGRPVE